MAGHGNAPPRPAHNGRVEMLEKRGCHLSLGNVEEKCAGVTESRVDQQRYLSDAVTSSRAGR